MLRGLKKLQYGDSKVVQVDWVRTTPSAWICSNLGNGVMRVPNNAQSAKVEALASKTNQLGQQPIWEGYKNLREYKYDVQNATRTANQVRTSQSMGCFYSHIVKLRKPATIVEFGTAFGVSGMYWLVGLESNGMGRLLTFEPNEVWGQIAFRNLAAISDRFQLIPGTFEENVDSHLVSKIDIAFIDAIHTSEFVFPQFNLVVERLAPGGLVLLDDIGFSDDMRSCWETISHDRRVKASAIISGSVGILEL